LAKINYTLHPLECANFAAYLF